jgi:hypothetical protein
VAGHHAERRDVILSPDANSSVTTRAGKVVAERTPLDRPDRTIMAFIHHKASPSQERPEAAGAIGGTGDEELRGGGGDRVVGIRGAFNRWREGNSVNRLTVSDEATRTGRGVVLMSSDEGRKGFAVHVPNANIRFLRANSDKVVIIRELDAGNAMRRSAKPILLAKEKAYESRELWNVNMQIETPGGVPLLSAGISILKRSLFSLIF